MVVTLVIAQWDFEAKVWDGSFIHQILTGQGKLLDLLQTQKLCVIFFGPASAAQDLSYHCQRLHFHSRLCPFQAVFDDKLTTKHISQAALLIKSTMRGIATSISDKHL